MVLFLFCHVVITLFAFSTCQCDFYAHDFHLHCVFALSLVILADQRRSLHFFGAEYIVGVTLGCLLANLLGSTMVDVVFGTAATLIACLATYALRNVRWKGLAIPASFPPVIANALIVGAFEITVFFSDSAPTATMAVFNAVAVGVGEIISCCVLGVALVKLIESNESLNKIFAE